MSAPADRLALRLTAFEVTGATLELAYEVRNESPHRLFLVNRLMRRTGDGLRIDPDLVYAHMRPGPVLELGKHLIPIPDDLDVEVPEVPGLTPVDAGGRFAETIHVPVPVGAHDPYVPQHSGDAIATVERAAWTLGYVTEETPLPAYEQDLATGGRAWRMDYGDLVGLQRTQTVDVDDVAVATVIDIDTV